MNPNTSLCSRPSRNLSWRPNPTWCWVRVGIGFFYSELTAAWLLLWDRIWVHLCAAVVLLILKLSMTCIYFFYRNTPVLRKKFVWCVTPVKSFCLYNQFWGSPEKRKKRKKEKKEKKKKKKKNRQKGGAVCCASPLFLVVCCDLLCAQARVSSTV